MELFSERREESTQISIGMVDGVALGERNKAFRLVKPGVHDEEALLGGLASLVPEDEEDEETLGDTDADGHFEKPDGLFGG